jgi:hypothetical protein
MESGYILWDTCRWVLRKSYWKEHPNPSTENNEEISDKICHVSIYDYVCLFFSEVVDAYYHFGNEDTKLK